jgi:hypothetical protein
MRQRGGVYYAAALRHTVAEPVEATCLTVLFVGAAPSTGGY